MSCLAFPYMLGTEIQYACLCDMLPTEHSSQLLFVLLCLTCMGEQAEQERHMLTVTPVLTGEEGTSTRAADVVCSLNFRNRVPWRPPDSASHKHLQIKSHIFPFRHSKLVSYSVDQFDVHSADQFDVLYAEHKGCNN